MPIFAIYYTLVVIFLGAILFLLGLFVTGSFQPCKRCGSKLTIMRYQEIPDASRGSRIMHAHAEQRCYSRDCRKSTVVQGISTEPRNK